MSFGTSFFKNEAFRGHDERDSSSNQGKFRAEIKFLAKYHPPLQKWLDTHPENVSWLSPDVQNEMIKILADHILYIVKMQVKQRKYYTVEWDDVTSHKHSYTSIVLRYVYNNIIYERVIRAKTSKKLDREVVIRCISSETGQVTDTTLRMVGKAFDGA